MILRCLAVTITRNRKGQPIRSAKLVTGDPISIGRSPQSSVYLADPRVHFDHAQIRTNDLGKLYLEAQGAPIEVNGELQERTKLRRGARILIGPYQITPEPPASADQDFGLAIELVHPITEGASELRERSRVTLASTHLSKRGLGWALLAIVAGFGLALPLAHATSPADLKAATAAFTPNGAPIAWTAAWNPGPLSAGHHALTADCRSCHKAAFESVPDTACISCHKETGEHVRKSSALAGVRIEARCAECHTDHQGENVISRAAGPQICVDCHSNIKSRHPSTTLAPVGDFASGHPEFALNIVDPATGQSSRVTPAAGQRPKEASGLKFPHATHLAAKGIRSPSGVKVLACANCHVQDELNERFQAVNMKETCSECHRLEFEPALTSREAPHGDPALILTTLREFYARIALGDKPIDVVVQNDLLRRPGRDVTPLERANALAWADRKARAVATDLIEARVCVQCHMVSRNEAEPPAPMAITPGVSEKPVAVNSPWIIAPVKVTNHWLPGASFDHKSHRASTCESCHDVRKSLVSSDVAIPDLKSCQNCHGGDHPAPGKLRSPCQTCHGYHQQPPGGPRMPVVRPVATSAGAAPQ